MGRTRAARRRRPWGSRVLAIAALVLALAGVALIGWAASHQVEAPSAPAAEPPDVSAPLEGGGAGRPVGSTTPAPGARLVVQTRPPAPPWFMPGPLFGGGPGSVSVRVEVPRPVAPAPLPGPPELPVSAPARLVVPAIGVDAPVGTVGLNPDGTMEVPAPGPLYDLPAWYRFSVTPGQRGPSVIVGHVDSRVGGPSVFFDLARLRPGDVVEVDRADRSRARFAVSEIRRFPKDAFPTEAVYAGTADPELRLITCGGSFDYAVRSYRDNTVVFARSVA